MPKAKARTVVRRAPEPIVLPPANIAWDEAEKIIPLSTFEQLPFWHQLRDAEQTRLTTESYHLVIARKQHGMSKLAMGQHLAYVQEMLKNRTYAFKQYLNLFNFSGRTGYRLIEFYKQILGLVNEPVLKVMVSTGFKLSKATNLRPLGEFTEAYKALAMVSEVPPTNSNMDAAIRYVKKLQSQYESLQRDPRSMAVVKKRLESESKVKREKRDSLEYQLKHSFHTVKAAIRKMDGVSKKEELLERLVGYLLADRGVASKRFDAQSIPPDLQRPPGRPRKDYGQGSSGSSGSLEHEERSHAYSSTAHV